MKVEKDALPRSNRPPGRLMLGWLTPWRCQAIFAAMLVLNFAVSWRFLTVNCPIDLSGDEAQYWDWSRHLDISYYSKGPMVAYLIRASCACLGETMPAVRFPALVLAVGTSICTYWLTRRLFGSDRLALGAVLMQGIVPLYAAGGMLMTIDPPFFFFWALATCLVVKAVFDHRNWAWPAAGVAAGLGVLTKYAMLLWPVIVLLFLLIDKPSRPKLKTIGPWLMSLISLFFLAPILIWNARHQWVSLYHVAAQTGTDRSGGWGRGNLLAFLGSQLGALNPFVAGLMVAAVVWVLREKKHSPLRLQHATPSRAQDQNPPRLPDHLYLRGRRFLLCIGGSLFVLCLLDSLVTKVQANWPAPAYFTLLILTACFVADQWITARRWFIAALVFGMIMQPILRDMTRLYPIVAWINHRYPNLVNKDGEPKLRAKNVDLEYKLRGIKNPFADTVAQHLAALPTGSFVLCEAYEEASQLAFYLPGQPKTYFAGSYWTEPFPIRRRWTQFDIWPDRALDRPELIGRDCIYLGTMAYEPLMNSFVKVEKLPPIVIRRRSVVITWFEVWKCTGFKGMKRPSGQGAR